VTHEWLIVQAFAFLMNQDHWQDQLPTEFDLGELAIRYPLFVSSLKEKLLV
jgi:hypothetical protein